jgi:hypothetical protein
MRPTAAIEAVPDKEVSLRVGDVLGRIPVRFLKKGPHDVRGELRFNVREIFEKITRGRASLPLSKIAQLCPQLFRIEVGAIDDVEIPLPLQKLVEQVGLFASSPRGSQNHASAPRSRNVESQPGENGTHKPFNDQQQTIVQQTQSPAPSHAPQETKDFAGDSRVLKAINGTEQKEKPSDSISLALAPIFRLLPGSVAPDPCARISLPMAWVEPQLAGGHVEISLDDFFDALPENLRIYMIHVADVRVWIPLDEIFQNLPAHHQYHIGAATVLVENESSPGEHNLELSAKDAVDSETLSAQIEQPDFKKASETEIISILSTLPGIFACIAISKNGTLAVPNFPGEIERSSLETALNVFQNLSQTHTGSLRWTRTLTLRCADFFLTVAVRDSSGLCVLHREQALDAVALDRLGRAADEFERRHLQATSESSPSLPSIEKLAKNRIR